MNLKGRKIILGVCGSIAAYKALILLRLLTKSGAEVKVVMTKDAQHFVGKLSFASLTSQEVYTDLVIDQEWKNHVDLGLWADLILIAPATAQTISKFAHGLVDNLITAIYLSAKCPTMIAPAMDLDMWAHPATKSNISILKQRGVSFVPVGHGPLASGLVGEGRLAEAEDIFKFVNQFFEINLDLANKKILVTAGPSQEAIDPVRYISNYSSGKMGIRIAEEAARRGAIVELILGPSHEEIESYPNLHVSRVVSASDMMLEVDKFYHETDYFILAAAVADFQVEQYSNEKIKKQSVELEIKLKPTVDIAKFLGEQKKPSQKIVGFALETHHILENAQAKLNKKNMDMIVINSPLEEGSAFGHDTNRIDILKRNGEYLSFELKTKKELAKDIIDQMLKLS